MRKIAICIVIIVFMFCGCSNSFGKESNTVESISVGLEGIDVDKPQAGTTTDPQETAPLVSCNEYEINGITYNVPDVWMFDSQMSSGEAVFTCGQRSVMLVTSETIPQIMKMDVGENSITSKEDVARFYGIDQEDTNFLISGTQWATLNGFEYCDFWFNCVGKLSTGDQDERIGRCVVIPINETDAVFSILMLCDNDLDYLEHIDIILSSLDLDELVG